MTPTSDWDHRFPPVPDPYHRDHEDNREPVGYNLGDLHYEQPPAPLLPAYVVTSPALPPSGQAIAGFVVSLVGLGVMFLPFVNVAASIVGLILSGISLRRCRQGVGGGRGFAIAGLVLGIVGIMMSALLILFFLAVFPASGP
jgi:hypothetical protein